MFPIELVSLKVSFCLLFLLKTEARIIYLFFCLVFDTLLKEYLAAEPGYSLHINDFLN